MSGLHIRRAGAEDCRLLWEWANDPKVREASFTTGPIPWVTHQGWFAERLNDRYTYFYILCENDGEPVAQARFECQGTKATLSFSVSPQHRGKGYGRALLTLSASALFNDSQMALIEALVKPGNSVSLCALSAAGFADEGKMSAQGQAARRMVLHRQNLKPHAPDVNDGREAITRP